MKGSGDNRDELTNWKLDLDAHVLIPISRQMSLEGVVHIFCFEKWSLP